MNIIELAKAAHENAVNKGWWQEERTYGELIALVHSEVSEALEDYRAGKKPNEVWYEKYDKQDDEMYVLLFKPDEPDWKPCGIPSELADVCIRIFDIAGKYGWAEDIQDELDYLAEEEPDEWYQELNFVEKFTMLHFELSNSWKSEGENVRRNWLAQAFNSVMHIAKENGIDLDAAIAEKMAYNATRPQRHGGKVI